MLNWIITLLHVFLLKLVFLILLKWKGKYLVIELLINVNRIYCIIIISIKHTESIKKPKKTPADTKKRDVAKKNSKKKIVKIVWFVNAGKMLEFAQLDSIIPTYASGYEKKAQTNKTNFIFAI